MPPSYNDEGRRISSSRQRSGGRSADERVGDHGAGGDNNRSVSRSSASLRSQHYILPEDYSAPSIKAKNRVLSPATSSSTANGNNSPKSPIGAPLPPPPPPPPPPYLRGRNTAANNCSRGRSLSTARSASQLRSSKHGEEKDIVDASVADESMHSRRHRSLSIARYGNKPAPTAPPAPSQPFTTPLPLIDANGRQQTRRSRSRPKSRGRVSGGGQQQQQPKESKRSSSSKKSSSSSKAVVASSSTSAASASRDSPKQQPIGRRMSDASLKSFKQVMTENSASHRGRSRSRSRSNSRGRSRSVSRSRSRAGSRSRGATTSSTTAPVPVASTSSITSSSPATMALASVDQPDQPSASSSSSRGTSSSGSGSSSSRKFVVEISEVGEVVQVFEFSDNGAPPDESSKSRQQAIIEKIKRSYSSGGGGVGGGGDDGGSRAAPSSSSSSSSSSRSRSASRTRSRSASRTRGASSSRSIRREVSTTRKIVVESDSQDNLKQVLELTPAKDGAASCSREPSSQGSDSGEDEQPEKQQPATTMPPSALRSSLRSSLEASKGFSVSFLLDDDDRDDGTSKPSSASAASSAVPYVLDTSNKSDGSSETSPNRASSSGRSVSFMMDKQQQQQDNENSQDQSSFRPSRGDARSSASDFDNSERSDESSGSRSRSVSFAEEPYDHDSSLKLSISSQTGGPPPLDISERSEESSGSNLRRSVSFVMDHQDDLQARGGSTRPMPYHRQPRPLPPATRGRSAVATRPLSEEDLQGLRRARSLSNSHIGDRSLVINDTSSMTASVASGGPNSSTSSQSRGRSSRTASTTSGRDRSRPPPPRQARSLSRTRNTGVMLRDNIDFDPAASITESYQQHQQQQYGHYPTAFGRDALPYGEMPAPHKSLVSSHGTAETYSSSFTFEEEEASHFTAGTAQAVKVEDPLMNSYLTIYEECEDDDDCSSVLSDPTSLADEGALRAELRERGGTRRHAAAGRGTKVHVVDNYDDEDLKRKQERRSKIRSMLSRKAYRRRRAGPSSYSTDVFKDPSPLDSSEETRDTLGSSDPSILDNAENSLMMHQQQPTPAAGRESKSRLSRFLHR